MEDTTLSKNNPPPIVKGRANFHSVLLLSHLQPVQIRAAAPEKKGEKPIACLISFL